jgi:hypothetical protein
MLYIDSRASRAWRMLESSSANASSQKGTRGGSTSGTESKINTKRGAALEPHRRSLDEQDSALGEGVGQGGSQGGGVKSTSNGPKRSSMWWEMLETLQSGSWRRGLGQEEGGIADCVPPGALAVELSGAKFVFLRPVHSGRMASIQDHLITNEVYLGALAFEAQVFRHKYLSFWRRLRSTPRTHHLLASTTGTPRAAAGGQETGAGAALGAAKDTNTKSISKEPSMQAALPLHRTQRPPATDKNEGWAEINEASGARSGGEVGKWKTLSSSLSWLTGPGKNSIHSQPSSKNAKSAESGQKGPQTSRVEPRQKAPATGHEYAGTKRRTRLEGAPDPHRQPPPAPEPAGGAARGEQQNR